MILQNHSQTIASACFLFMFFDVRELHRGHCTFVLLDRGRGREPEKRGEEGSWETWAEERLECDRCLLALSQPVRRSWMFRWLFSWCYKDRLYFTLKNLNSQQASLLIFLFSFILFNILKTWLLSLNAWESIHI